MPAFEYPPPPVYTCIRNDDFVYVIVVCFSILMPFFILMSLDDCFFRNDSTIGHVKYTEVT